MEKAKTSKLVIFHLVLMVLLFVLSIVSAVIVFTGNIPAGFEASKETYKTTTTLYGLAHIVNAMALMHGIVYILKGSSKAAANWYKTLVLLVAFGVVLRLVGTLIYPGFGVNVCLMIGIIAALLALRFVKNLGARNSWIIFGILIALELILAVITFDKNEMLSSIAGNLSRLVLDGTIGLALREKYLDKAARNTY